MILSIDGNRQANGETNFGRLSVNASRMQKLRHNSANGGARAYRGVKGVRASLRRRSLKGLQQLRSRGTKLKTHLEGKQGARYGQMGKIYQDKDWFHGSLSREEAVERVTNNSDSAGPKFLFFQDAQDNKLYFVYHDPDLPENKSLYVEKVRNPFNENSPESIIRSIQEGKEEKGGFKSVATLIKKAENPDHGENISTDATARKKLRDTGAHLQHRIRKGVIKGLRYLEKKEVAVEGYLEGKEKASWDKFRDKYQHEDWFAGKFSEDDAKEKLNTLVEKSGKKTFMIYQGEQNDRFYLAYQENAGKRAEITTIDPFKKHDYILSVIGELMGERGFSMYHKNLEEHDT